MSVYTRIPEKLSDTPYDLFAVKGANHPRKQHPNLKVQEQTSTIIGKSIPSSENSEKLADEINSLNHSQHSKRLKIPSHFLKEVDGMDKASSLKITDKFEGNRQNDIKTDKKVQRTMKNDPKSEILVERREDIRRMSLLGSENSGDLDEAGYLNKPSSKLIQDNQDLQKLFDSVRGKGSQEQQYTKVGKLNVPPKFNMDRNYEKWRNSNIAHHKVGIGASNASGMNDAVAVTFNEWKNDKKDDEESEEINYRMKGGFNTQESTAMLNKQKINLHNDSARLQASNTKTEGSVKSYWLGKSKQQQKVDHEAGHKENMSARNKTFMGDMNLATSTDRELNEFSGKQLHNAKPKQPFSLKSKKITHSSDMDQGRDRKSLSGSSYVTEDYEKCLRSPIGDENGFDTVGKLRLPAAFADNKDRKFDNAYRYKGHGAKLWEEPNTEDEWGSNIVDAKHTRSEENHNNTKSYIFDMDDYDSVKDSQPGDVPLHGVHFSHRKSCKDICAKEEERDVKSHKGSKPIGRLDIKAIFSQDKREFIPSKAKGNSVITKSKAIFDVGGSKRGEDKQRRIGGLRVGASNSERYEEIKNLSPEGQVPSNMSDQMKDQLEKILQSRSESVSSQVSLSSSSSKPNDSKEVGRLSSSSIASLETSLMSSRTSQDLSSRSLNDDSSTAVSDYKGDDNGSKIQVNRENLEFQLGNILKKKNEGEDSFLSIGASSSIVDGNVQEAKSINDGEEVVQQRANRKMVIDEIKEKYTNDQEMEDAVKNESCKKEVERFHADTSEFIKNKDELENHESSRERDEDNMQKGIGRISIVNLFESKRNDEMKTIQPINTRRSNIKKYFKEDFLAFNKDKSMVEVDFKKPIEIEQSEIREVTYNDPTESSNKTKDKIQVVNSFSGSLREKKFAWEKSVNHPEIDNNRNKGKNTDMKGSVDHISKKVTFDTGAGSVREDGGLDSVSTEQAAVGKLSLSLLQSFDGGNSKLYKQGASGRDEIGRTKEILAKTCKEEGLASPIAEEKVVNESIDMASKRVLLKSGKTDKLSSHDPNIQCGSTEAVAVKHDRENMIQSVQTCRRGSPRKDIGKLSIPVMFK